MEKRLRITWFVLMILTLLSGILALFAGYKPAVYAVLLLAAIKFNLVAFEFMGVRYAHPFWKWFIRLFSFTFVGIYMLLLS